MPYVTTEQIQHAKRMDLLSYLQAYEPFELVRFCNNVYTTRSHDSLKISNGKWKWWSRDIGGRSALDYLIKVRGMMMPEAVLQINGHETVTLPPRRNEQVIEEPKKLLLPERNVSNDQVIRYLKGRGIHHEIIDYCIRTGRLYESRQCHNAVFIGFDRKGLQKYAALRGTSGKRYMGEANGSDKNFSFSIPSRQESHRLQLFESAIDLLSYSTLELLTERDWREDNYLSLAGIYKPKENIKESTPPAALVQYLKDFPDISSIALHLDNDTPGRLASKAIQTIFSPTYKITDEPPKRGKDVNDFLKTVLNIQVSKYERV